MSADLTVTSDETVLAAARAYSADPGEEQFAELVKAVLASMNRDLSVEEAAALLGLSPREVRRKCTRRELEHVRHGPRVIRLPLDVVLAFRAGRLVRAKVRPIRGVR